MSDGAPDSSLRSDGGVEAELSRDMGLYGITFIGIGAMIGAGVFALTGFAAGLAGPALLLAFLLNGAIASLTAMSYAELGSAFPRSGGAYNWVTEAIPRPWGFFTGWTNWFAQAIACALYAVTFGVFLTEFVVVYTGLPHDFVFFGFLTRHLVEKLLAAIVVGLFAYVNYRGAEETGKVGIVVTTAKVVILGVFVVFGALATIERPQWPVEFLGSPAFAPNGLVGVFAAMGFTYVAFEGYDIIVQSGEEVIDPGENIPKAIFYSLIVVIPIYVLVAFAAIGGIEPTRTLLDIAGLTNVAPGAMPGWELLGNLGELGIIRAAEQFVPYGVALLLVAGLAATMSALNATLYASSRIAFSMSRDARLPDRLAQIHPDTRAPYVAIAVSGLIIGLMALTLPIESVAASSSVMFILLFSMVNVAAIAMRRNRPDLDRPFSIPFMPIPPLLGIGFQLLLTPFLLWSLGLTPGMGPESQGFVALVTMLVWFAIGIAVYYSYTEKREVRQLEREAPTVVSRETPARRTYQLLVPIANPANVERLMRTAIDVARDHDGEILVLSVVTVPQQTPLDQGLDFIQEYIDEQQDIIEEAVSFAEGTDVPVNGTIRVGHSVDDAILNTIEQKGSDGVLMGWRGRSYRRDIVLGSNVDEVVKNASSDVLVEKLRGASEGETDSILVPTAGGPHAELAAETAGAIARSQDASVHVIYVVDPDASAETRQTGREALERAERLIGEDVVATSDMVEGTDITDTLVREADDHDLTIMGAAREGLLQQVVFGAIPEEVGLRSESTVIMAKRHLGIRSAFREWFDWR